MVLAAGAGLANRRLGETPAADFSKLGATKRDGPGLDIAFTTYTPESQTWL